MSALRPLPKWRSDPFAFDMDDSDPAHADVLLFADTFNRYFEPDNLRAANAVLRRAGMKVAHAVPLTGTRPLCCGRTFLSAGLTDKAADEMQRTIDAVRPVLERGGYVVGLEPSCLLTFRDEAPALLGSEWNEELGSRIVLFEELIARKYAEGSLQLELSPLPVSRALLHGHCHQKAFNVLTPVQQTLALIPGLEVELIQTSCCGMAGAFGYQAETYEVSRAMGELTLMPRIRDAASDTIVVADGTSCRHQIADMTGRGAVHVAQVLRAASNDA